MYDVLFQYVDLPFITLLQEFTGKSVTFDKMIVHLESLYSLKMFPFVLYILAIYYGTNNPNKTRLLTTAILSAFLTIVVSRLLQDALPGRPRPLYANLIQFVPPLGMDGDDVLADWSSFPSDTSALAFALVSSIWLYSRRAGVLLFGWALAFVCFPRAFAGYHYLSDIIGGLIVGLAATWAANTIFRALSERLFTYFMERLPTLVHVGIFIIMFQISTMFDDVRTVAEELAHDVLPKLLG
jgi:membrane-associated phospholipid phosphatase